MLETENYSQSGKCFILIIFRVINHISNKQNTKKMTHIKK